MKYILMHRELPVAVLSINDTSGTVYRVEDVVQPAHLPIGLFSADRREFAKNLNLWLAGRTIPASRSGFHHALEALQIQKKLQLSASTLMMKCFALSLSDQYWLNPAEQPLEWRKVNFYHNDFSEDVGNILFGQMHNGVIARALVLDKLVSTYLAQHPGAVVNITCRASPCFLHIFYNAANPIFSE